MKVLGITWVFVLGACDVVLEADPGPPDLAPVPADALPVDAEPDAAELDAACLPVPPLVRFEDVPVGEEAAAAVPLGCGHGLLLRAARLERVTPPEAFALPDHLPTVPVDHLRLTYRPRLVAEQASAVLVLVTESAEYTVPVAASARWSDAACRHWEIAALATGVDGLLRLEATPPPGVAPTAALVSWSVVVRPAGSVAAITEDFQAGSPGEGVPDDPTTPGAWFLMDIQGLYEIECTVKPPATSGCPLQQARLRAQLCPCLDDLRVRLTWTADGAGVPADLDLHVLHPTAAAWGAPGLDCSPRDLDPRWTSGAGPLGRPTHTGDDTTAPGFEGVQLARAEGIDTLPGPYRVAVENRAERAVEATLQIFIAERMVWQGARRLAAADGWWDVAGVGWHRGALVAAPIDRTWPAEPAPDPWAPLGAGAGCLPGQPPPCVDGFVCRDDDGALVGQCRR